MERASGSVVSAAGIALAFPLAVFLVGGGSAARVRDLDAEERLAAALGVGIAVLAGAQFLVFAAGLGHVVASRSASRWWRRGLGDARAAAPRG